MQKNAPTGNGREILDRRLARMDANIDANDYFLREASRNTIRARTSIACTAPLLWINSADDLSTRRSWDLQQM